MNKNIKKQFQIISFLLIVAPIQPLSAEETQIPRTSIPSQAQESNSSSSISNLDCQNQVKPIPNIPLHKPIIRQPQAKPENINIYCPSLPTGAMTQTVSVDSRKEKINTEKSEREMNWLSFLEKLIEVLVWPIFGTFLIYKIWPDFKSLLPFIKKIKAGFLEAEFGSDLEALRLEAAIAQEGDVPIIEDPEQKNELLLLAQQDPRSGVLEAWRKIIIAAKKTIVAKGIRELSRVPKSDFAIARILRDEKILNPDDLILFNELKALRNEVSDDFNPTYQAAADFIQLATILISKLIEENADSVRKLADNNVDKLNVAARSQKEDGQGVKL